MNKVSGREMAEDLESASDLHRLCSIMKMLILLNDTSIIEYVVNDEIVLGVVGALECKKQREDCLLSLADIFHRRSRLSPPQGQSQAVSVRRIEI